MNSQRQYIKQGQQRWAVIIKVKKTQFPTAFSFISSSIFRHCCNHRDDNLYIPVMFCNYVILDTSGQGSVVRRPQSRASDGRDGRELIAANELGRGSVDVSISLYGVKVPSYGHMIDTRKLVLLLNVILKLRTYLLASLDWFDSNHDLKK